MLACALANDAPLCDAYGRGFVVLVSRSSCLFSQGAEYAAAVAQSIAEDNARAGPVFISGATGSLASVVNGYYEPTEEKGADGRVMYAKRGDGGVCIEHFGGFWQVKRVEDRGKSACMASVAGGCALVDCVARVWYRASAVGPTEDMDMKLWTGDDAEQEVSGCCMAHKDAFAVDAVARACVL